MSSLPTTLDAFLDERIRLFIEPPDTDWVYGVAQVYATTTEVVWQGVHARIPDAPAAPRPYVLDTAVRPLRVLSFNGRAQSTLSIRLTAS